MASIPETRVWKEDGSSPAAAAVVVFLPREDAVEGRRWYYQLTWENRKETSYQGHWGYASGWQAAWKNLKATYKRQLKKILSLMADSADTPSCNTEDRQQGHKQDDHDHTDEDPAEWFWKISVAEMGDHTCHEDTDE